MYSISCKNPFKYTVMYGVCTAFLARISSNIRSCTVYVQHFLQESLQIYGHVRCMYSISCKNLFKCKVIYGVCTAFLASNSSNIRSCTVYVQHFLQESLQMYGHIRCMYSISCKNLFKCTVMYGVNLCTVWPTQFMQHEQLPLYRAATLEASGAACGQARLLKVPVASSAHLREQYV